MNRAILPLLTLGLSLAPILCWAAEPNSEEAKAIAVIERLGGRVSRDEKSPGKPVSQVDLISSRVTDVDLEYLKGLSQLKTLYLGYIRVTDSGLERLKGLSQLKTLYLGGTERHGRWPGASQGAAAPSIPVP